MCESNKTYKWLTYKYKDDNDDEFIYFDCDFLLCNDKKLCIVTHNDNGNKFIEGAEKIIPSELFPSFLMDKFSSFDYYNKDKNNQISFEDYFDDVIECEYNNFEPLGGYSYGECSIASEVLSDYFRPLIDFLENSTLWERDDNTDEQI